VKPLIVRAVVVMLRKTFWLFLPAYVVALGWSGVRRGWRMFRRDRRGWMQLMAVVGDAVIVSFSAPPPQKDAKP
jgi:hypothetical protein